MVRIAEGAKIRPRKVAAPRPAAAPRPRPIRPARVRPVKAAAAPRPRAAAAPRPRAVKSPFRPIGNPKAAAIGRRVAAKKPRATVPSGSFVRSGKLNTRQVNDTRRATGALTRSGAYASSKKRGGWLEDSLSERPAPWDKDVSSAEMIGENLPGAQPR
jgi:hypothetical protein